MKLSIVATLYQSAPYVSEFYQRASAAAKQLLGEDYEIVLVNDGSPDNSLDLAVQITESDSHVVVVDLSRNFGHHKAMMTGLAHTKGDQVLLIDSDLEEEPECLIAFAEQMQSQRCDVVYGIQEQRKGGWFERWSGQWFYRFFKALAFRIETKPSFTFSCLVIQHFYSFAPTFWAVLQFKIFHF